MGEPLISVLIPAYQAEKLLPRCLNSVLSSDWGQLEAVVVDDGSEDGTWETACAFARQDSRVRVIRHQKNRGVSAGRNTALEAAAGEWLCFVDSDDTFSTQMISELYRIASSMGVRLAACNHSVVEADGRAHSCFPVRGEKKTISARECADNLLYHGVPDVCCWAKLYHRSLFQGLRYPEGRLYEDTFLAMPLIVRAEALAYLDEPLYQYHLEGASITRSAWTQAKMDYLDAVHSMTACIRSLWPEMERGCVRREVHALLSVRRYLTGSPPELLDKRGELDRQIRSKGVQVLLDRRAPLRDKAAIGAEMISPAVFDWLWKRYANRQGR